jgi:hypothetical protein
VNLEIFPPPVDDHEKYRVVDIFGNTVREGAVGSTKTIDTEDLLPGIYLIRSGGFVCKLVVLH